MKATLKVYGLSFIFALIVVLMDIISYLLKEKTYVDIFLGQVALQILSIMYPIIISAFLSLKLYSVQIQTKMLHTEYDLKDQELAEKIYESYTIIDTALLRIVKVLFWAFIIFLGTHLVAKLIDNIWLTYGMSLIQMTIFISFFYGLYQMVVMSIELLIPHK